MKSHAAFISGLLFALTPTGLPAAEADYPSAVEAMASLPPGAKENLAAVIGYDGKPTPDRWRFIVWDATAENGFREYVVLGGKLVSQNIISQFASTISERDRIAAGTLRLDSTKVSWLALQYARANGLKVAALSFELRRTESDQTPVWKVDCYDALEQPMGSISIAADEGNVLARNGLPREPGNRNSLKEKPTPESRQPKERPLPPVAGDPRRVARQSPPDSLPPEAVAEDADRLDGHEVRKAEPVQRKQRPFSVGRLVRSIIPF